MCDCISEVEKMLAPHNTRLSTNLHLSNPMRVTVRIETLKVDKKVRKGPVTMVANYCPFCGVKYVSDEKLAAEIRPEEAEGTE